MRVFDAENIYLDNIGVHGENAKVRIPHKEDEMLRCLGDKKRKDADKDAPRASAKR